MKRYVWIAALLAGTVGAGASENPFELNENFQKLEQEQESLLKELKSASAKLEALQEAEDDADIDAEEDEDETEEAATPAAETEEVVVETIEPPKKAEVPQASETENTVAKVKRKASETPQTPKATPTKTEAPKEIVRIEKVKEDQAKIDAARAAQMKARAEAEAKRKAEVEKAKREKEALAKLEAERAAAKKKAEEAELERLKAQKARLEAEKAQLEKEAKAKTETPAPVKSAVSSKSAKTAVASVDINITKEEMEAAKRAEEELKKAIAEVDQED